MGGTRTQDDDSDSETEGFGGDQDDTMNPSVVDDDDVSDGKSYLGLWLKRPFSPP